MKKKALIESVTNTVIGLVTSFLIQLIIYPLLDIDVRLSQNVIITFVFLLVSIIRGYLVRILFSRLWNN